MESFGDGVGGRMLVQPAELPRLTSPNGPPDSEHLSRTNQYHREKKKKKPKKKSRIETRREDQWYDVYPHFLLTRDWTP
jgi:hypothetical protein